MNIRPIETRYAGCRFRSRLEARWAVFFDALEWPWTFEPQGYELPSGRYLPDFQVTSSSGTHWFEVKPYTDDLPDEQRWYELVRDSGVFMIVGYGMHRNGDGCLKAWNNREHAAHAGRIVLPNGDSHLLGPFWSEPRYADAWDRASSARFEFGESG